MSVSVYSSAKLERRLFKFGLIMQSVGKVCLRLFINEKGRNKEHVLFMYLLTARFSLFIE